MRASSSAAAWRSLSVYFSEITLDFDDSLPVVTVAPFTATVSAFSAEAALTLTPFRTEFVTSDVTFLEGPYLFFGTSLAAGAGLPDAPPQIAANRRDCGPLGRSSATALGAVPGRRHRCRSS